MIRSYDKAERIAPADWLARRVYRFSPNLAHYLRARARGWRYFHSSEIVEQVCGDRFGIAHAPTLAGREAENDSVYDTWADAPFKSEREALEFLGALQRCSPVYERTAVSWSQGKARELDLARRAADWPEASDEVLCLPKEALHHVLVQRLPAMLASFRLAMNGAGFYLSPADARARGLTI